MPRVMAVAGLGYGDEGKGARVNYLCHKHRARLVVRYGGPQAYHRVVRADGREFIFSQLGSGTLTGAATHLSQEMLVDPWALINEADALSEAYGASDPLRHVTAHEDCLITTPFQVSANRLRELFRGSGRRGSVGIGVGETIRDAELLGADALRMRDLLSPKFLAEKLDALRLRKREDLAELLQGIGEMPPDAREQAQREADAFNAPGIVEVIAERFAEVGRRVLIVGTDYLAGVLRMAARPIIVEGSQGVLLDRWYGFHPYTTKVRTTFEPADAVFAACGFTGTVEHLGVLRAYHTRHGGGPFVAESQALTEALPDAVNGDHPWQGSFRVGHFDLIAATYAIEAARRVDGIALTCMDRIQARGAWSLCTRYQGPASEGMFVQDSEGLLGRITVRHGTGAAQLARQEALTACLAQSTPLAYTCRTREGVTVRQLAASYSGFLQQWTQTPVTSVSFGPTEGDWLEL